MKPIKKKESRGMTVQFALLGKDGAEYDESKLDGIIRSGRLPCRDGDFDGVLRLKYPSQEDLVLRDDLHGLIPRLCVEVVLGCLREGRAWFAMSTYFQQIAVTVEGDKVRVADDTQPPFEDFVPRLYPKAECFAALIACAQRFEDFLSRLVKKDRQWTEALERLRKGLAELGDAGSGSGKAAPAAKAKVRRSKN